MAEKKKPHKPGFIIPGGGAGGIEPGSESIEPYDPDWPCEGFLDIEGFGG